MARAIPVKAVNLFFLVVLASLQMLGQTEKAEACIRDMMQQSDVVGLSVAVVKNNKIIYTQSFGFKDSAANTPLTNDCLFHPAFVNSLTIIF